MIYLDTEDLLHIAGRVLGAPPQVRDLGLLGSSAYRPQTEAFGYEPYPTLHDKMAALLVSLTMNHALIDGNKRLALAAAWTMCEINIGRRPDLTNDQQYDLVMGVALGTFDVPEVAAALHAAGITE